MAANYFTPEEKHLLTEHSVGLCSRSQALTPTGNERLFHRAGRFPGAVCVTAAALPPGRAAAGAAPAGTLNVPVHGAASRVAFSWDLRGEERGGCSARSLSLLCLILAVKHCSAASDLLSFPTHILSSVLPPSSGNADGG